MRRRIHGWIVSLLLVGFGGLAIGAFVFRPAPAAGPMGGASSVSASKVDSADLASFLDDSAVRSSGTRYKPPAPLPPAIPTDPPEPFDVERFAAQAKERAAELEPPAAESPAAESTDEVESPTLLADSRPQPRSDTIVQIAFEAPEPVQAPRQEAGSRKPVETKTASQLTRPVSNPGGFPAAAQDQRVIQVQEPGQVPANIGQVEVQALDQLGVVILRGSPQDVEAMRKIIEEIQRISEGVEPYVRVFQLHRAPATQVRDKIQELYAGATSTTSGTSTQRGATGQPATTSQGGQQSATSVLQTPALRRFQITADDRSNTLVVLASPQMMEELSRLIERLDADGAPTVNEVRVFPLKNAEAQEVANILTEAISGQAAGTSGETIGGAAATVSGGGEARIAKRAAVLKFVPTEGDGRSIESGILDEVRVTAIIRTNSVIVSAPSSSMPLLASIVGELDRPPQIVAAMKIFELKYADATNMRITLAELFDLELTTGTGVGGGAAGTLGGANAQFQRPMAVAAGDNPPVSVRVAVDERTNSLIVTGPENVLLQVQAVIRTLDLSDIHNRRSTVYRLKNTYAIDVASTLTQFFTNKRQIEGQATGVNAASGTIVGAYTRLEQDVVVVALDNSLAATLTTAANITNTANPATQGVSNLLLISASPRNYEDVIKMIEELDAPQPQVMIQCIIAQLTLTDDYEFGIEFGLQNDVLFDRGTVPFTSSSTATNTTAGATTATNANPGVLPGNPGFNFNSTGPLGNSVAARAAQVGGQGLSNFALGRASLIDGLTNVGGLLLTASSKNVNAMLRALQNDGHLEVLSRPQIMTLDGRTARVLVGESFPYIGEVTATGTSGAIIPSVSFASIGVVLTVKPNITPDNRIYLEIVPEVSELKEIVNVQQIATATGTLNQQAPRITQTTANTVVSVNDGQTVVLGGLIQKRNAGFVRKIPWLGDLPHIGFLFRFTQEREVRQELMIIMTPHIVRSEADAQRIKDLEVARVNWILNNSGEMHGDLGLTQGPVEGPMGMDPMLDDSEMDAPEIQPMGGEEPSGPPADWLVPASAPAEPPGDRESEEAKKKTGGRLRRAFRRD